MPEPAGRHIVVFDLGGVLIDWNPRHLYRKLFDDDAAMERFLATVCTSAWNLKQDAGRPFDQAVAELQAKHPDQADLIAAYFARWPEMLAGAIEATVAILAELKALGVPLYGLTNWSAETFPFARSRFDFLDWFEAILVSGEVGLIKPDRRIFELLAQTHGFAPEHAVFIDDSPINAGGATAAGLHGIHFTGAPALRGELAALGFL
jgi:2-haloacid dehalogenase